MAEVQIQLGATDGFRYLGVQPPLTETQEETLRQAEYVVDGLPTRFSQVNPAKGAPYSETSYMSETYPTHDGVSNAALDAAMKLAGVLRQAGDTVTIDESFHHIGYGKYLFGGQANSLG